MGQHHPFGLLAVIGGCNCCDCPGPNLLCDSIAASKSKIDCAGCSGGHPYSGRDSDYNCLYAGDDLNCCGGFINPDNGLRYSIRTTVRTTTGMTSSLEFEGACSNLSTVIETIGSDCSVSSSSSSSDSYNITQRSNNSLGDLVETVISIGSCVDGVGSWSVETIIAMDSTSTTVTGTTSERACAGCGLMPWAASTTEVVTYSGPITPPADNDESTDHLKTRTIAALPAWPDTWDGPSSAFADLSDDETSYTIRRAKYKFKVTIPPGGYIKITWKVGGTPQSQIMSGMPGDVQYTATTEIDEPDSNGEISLTDVWWTCVPYKDPTGPGEP